MSIDYSAAPVKKLDPLNTLMDIRAVAVAPGSLTFAQETGERFQDHRGRTVLGSIGVMLDGVTGGAVYSGLTSDHQSVLAQITVSTAADFPRAGSVGAVGTLVHLDDGVGLASGELRDGNNTLLAVMAGRAMIVTRPPVVGIDDYMEAQPFEVPIPEGVSDLTGRSGSDVVEGILAGTIKRGPLAGLLDLTVSEVTPGSVVGEVAPVEWMANPLGAVQGGVLISVVDVITGLAAQTLTITEQDYRVLDHKIDFLRSPSIDGPVMRAEADVIRAGRRLALIESRIVDNTGQVYVRATSSIQMLSQQVHSE
ncbi:PaaI family thioesterase [Rhodococcus sp. ARC_M6]|uniref:PaaI family thioesterase n=1 Tax=Rhodococcus sp. ARC_M6 TaxID=2928852 RepID=UPI001FB494FA|nr:hotdog fold thioesterase [Rhodococcus sp. ARC_M6]MCJ0901915.1 hotdog fold thioesterase [Rhodococcus sp. ARC_M6]